MKRIALLLVLLGSVARAESMAPQVFITDDDAYCGTKQICEADLTQITTGSKISCEFLAPLRGGAIQVEGVLLRKTDPLMLLVETPIGVLPLSVPYAETEFCFTPLK
jgi:hypothetical protein